MEPVILASASPRRRELLERLGVDFEVCPSPIDEKSLQLSGSPAEQVQASALAKGSAVARLLPGRWCLSADTVVCIGTEILGKPEDPGDAFRMLKMLQGQCHRVLTGVCLIRQPVSGHSMHPGAIDGQPAGDLEVLALCEETKVWMAAMPEAQISAYIATGEPMDKAGAYAIQGFGSSLIERIHGCYFNVVGLPLFRTAQLLQSARIPIWQDAGR
jgi:septum formation protein